MLKWRRIFKVRGVNCKVRSCNKTSLIYYYCNSFLGESVVITSKVTCEGKTGVEMEALTAVSIAALTVYDMCKAVSHDMKIQEIKLIQKSGGKRDYQR